MRGSLGTGPIRQKMGKKHEKYLAKLFGGRQTKGSGNQWKDPADGRHNHHDPYAFAWDGKSTLANSISISRTMWGKIVEQAGGERPMLAIRFYDTEDLDVGYDLALIQAEDLAEMREEILRLLNAGAEYLETIGRLGGQLADLRADLAAEQESHRETEQAYNESRAKCQGLQAALDETVGVEIKAVP